MLAELHLLISATLTVHGSRDFFRPADVVGAEAVVACANEAARSLFNPERRIDVIDLDAGDLGNAIARTLTRDSGIFVANRWRPVKNERIPGFVVIEHGGFPSSRRMLMPGEPALRTLQFLFVTRSGVDAVRSFAGDLRDASYRDVAFLVFDEAAATGTVVRANSTGKEITLRSVGSCGPSGTDAHRIPAFTADARRYCPSGGCSVKYGMVADQTVRFWRKEDTLKLKRKDNLRAVGALLVEHFGDYYNVSVDSSAGNSMPWADAIARLISRDIDVVIGPRLSDLATLVDMEIVCWYMYRNMLFAGLVRFRAIRNDILLLLTPFHYFIWICVVVLLVAYILLLIALRRLFAAGLIKERVKFEYVCSIMLGQGVTFPGNSGLRLVMLLWMVFSLYLSITYNSTFTSSLAEVETEDLLKNLKQVRDSGQPLGGPAVILSYFNDSSDRAVQQLYYSYKPMGPEEALETIFSRNGLAVLQQFTVYRMNWDNRSNRSLRLYTLPKPMFKFPVFLYSRRGYIYRRPLRHLVTRYREIGMIQKLENVFVIDEDKQIGPRQSSDGILTMKHLRPVFEMYFMCLGVSLLILAVELLHVRVFHRSRTDVDVSG